MGKGKGINKRLTPLERERVKRRAAINEAWAKRHPEAAREQRSLRKAQAALAPAWKHKNEGTAETHEHASRTRQGALARLFERGHIDKDQLAWTSEIAAVAERIERDVTVRTASLEARVDAQRHYGDVLVEGIKQVRHERAYAEWRTLLPEPKRMVLIMVIGEPIPYSTAARRYHVSERRLRRLLIEAIDRWPGCLDRAYRAYDAGDLAAAHAGLL